MDIPRLVTRSELASWLGVSENTIYRLTQDGTLNASSEGYALKSSVQAYAKMQRTALRRSSAPKAATDAKTRLVEAQAREREIRADALAGKLVERAAVESEFATLGADYAARWGALPGRFSREAGLSADQARALAAAVHAVLSDFADARPAPLDLWSLY